MTQQIVSEFSSGWISDGAFLAASIRAGNIVDPPELINLCAGARCLYGIVTLACRETPHVRDCHRLWTEALEMFRRALAAWEGVDGDHLVTAYRHQLMRAILLAEDRVRLYSVPESERLSFARAYRSEFQ
jgi:hypothetical protein